MINRKSVKGLSAADVRVLLSGPSADIPDDLAVRVPQCLQVDVVVIDLAGDGYLITIGDHAVIVVARTEMWFRQNFTIAHELGHLAQDSLCDGHLDAKDGDEAGANRFAADLLMPEEEIRSLNWAAITLPVVARHVWAWGVSGEALGTRLNSLGVTARPEVLEALAQPTRGLLRRHLEGTPGRDVITDRSTRATQRRFPADLISRLESAVDAGRAPVESLAFAQGVDVSKLDVRDTLTEDIGDDLSLLEGLE